MTISFRPPAPSVGRFTAVILCFVVILCVSMIGATGYLKFRMDRAETLLAAPDAAVGSDQELFDRLRRLLGYGGFLGLAQNYATKHDASGFAEMKADIKSADDIVSHLPDKTPAETRHDLMGIVASFDAALQKISAPAGEANEFTSADLTPLYAAMPILEARVESANAETRLAAQDQMQFWGMLLTLVSWCSLIIAAACAAGIYLTLRDKHSAPMRALAQSIQNMARGDMRTAIWGTERQDMIGELARAVDIARYHFSHLPDLSLLSEQGPVRMRFEGGSRSLFEAMMKAISRDSENIREQTLSLGHAVKQQKESIALLSEKVETVLGNILQHGKDGDQQIRNAINEMVGSAESLKNAHAHAADQLSRLIPHIQDRATGMAEIAHLTGKQVAQTLQSLMVSEMNLKANAENAKDTLSRLSSTADDLGERLFGAINLLQASGKILAETTENMQGHVGAASAEPGATPSAPVFTPEIFAPMTSRLEQIAARIDELQGKISDQIKQQAELPAVAAYPAQDNIANETLSATAEQLRQGHAAFAATLAQIQSKLEEVGKNIEHQATAVVAHADPAANDKFDLSLLSGFEQLLAEKVEPKFAALEQNLEPKFAAALLATQTGNGETQSKFATLGQSIITQMQKKFEDLSTELRAHAGGIVDQNTTLSLSARESMLALSEKIAAFTSALPNELRQNFHADWQKISAQLDSVQAAIESHGEQQKRDIIDHNSFLSLQGREPILDLGQKVSALASALPGELQRGLQADWEKITAQIEAARTNIENHIDRQKHALIDHTGALASTLPGELRKNLEQDLQSVLSKIDIGEKIEAKLSSLEQALRAQAGEIALQAKGEMAGTLNDIMHALVGRIDGVRTSFDQLFGDRLMPELATIEGALGEQMRHLIDQTAAAAEHARNHMIELTGRLVDLGHILPGQLHDHLQEDITGMTAQIGALEQRMHAVVDQTDTASAMVREHLHSGMNSVAAKIGSLEEHMRGIADQAHAASAHAQGSMVELGSKLLSLAQALPQELRSQIQDEMSGLSEQVKSAQSMFENLVADKLAPQFPALEYVISEQLRGMAEQTHHSVAQMRSNLVDVAVKLADLIQTLPHEVRGQLQVDLSRISAQVDAARGEFSQAIAEHIAPKLAGLQSKVDMAAQNIETTRQSVEATRDLAQTATDELAKPKSLTYMLPPELQQQMQDHWRHIAAQIEASRMNVDRMFGEQVAGKLASFEQALVETRKMVEATREELAKPTRNMVALSPELQKQMHDHWSQVSTQIEAFRATLVDTISHEVEKMEIRMKDRSANSLSKTASDYATQRQIEQQTQILSELVATLGVLDAHMQQIKSEMHATAK